MPRHLSSALDAIAWPAHGGADDSYSGRHDVNAESLDRSGTTESTVAYLRSIAAWQAVGFAVERADRERIRDLWKDRPDLRDVLGETIGFYVCDEFKRPFLRRVLAGGSGAIADWAAAFPDLRPPLVSYFVEQTRRFHHPFDVVQACITLTRDLGEPPDTWRAAALAIKRDDRRQARRPRDRRSDFLRHDLETHGTLIPEEGAIVNRFLDELEATRLDVMQPGAWWHPSLRPLGEVLSLVARASHRFASATWSDEDTVAYAGALAALPPAAARSFATDRPFLDRIAEIARDRRIS